MEQDFVDGKCGHSSDLVQLARLALVGREQDVEIYVQRLARRLRRQEPEVADALTALLRERPTSASPLRREALGFVAVGASVSDQCADDADEMLAGGFGRT